MSTACKDSHASNVETPGAAVAGGGSPTSHQTVAISKLANNSNGIIARPGQTDPVGPTDPIANVTDTFNKADVLEGPSILSVPDEDAEETQTCAICLEPISEPARASPCQHAAFDFLCLVTWLQSQTQPQPHWPFRTAGATGSCPLCKTEVKEVQYDFGRPGEFLTLRLVADNDLSDNPPVVGGVPGTSGLRHAAIEHGRPPEHSGHGGGRPGGYKWARSRGGWQIMGRGGRKERFHASDGNADADTDPAVSRRRRVYRYGLFSLHVGTSARSGYAEFSPQMFARSKEMQGRAKAFVRRELQVFAFSSPTSLSERRNFGSRGDARFSIGAGAGARGAGVRSGRSREVLQQYILAILCTMDPQDSSGRALDLLSEFLGRDHAALFWHELKHFLRSRCRTLVEWDALVQYHHQPSDGDDPSLSGAERRRSAR